LFVALEQYITLDENWNIHYYQFVVDNVNIGFAKFIFHFVSQTSSFTKSSLKRRGSPDSL